MTETTNPRDEWNHKLTLAQEMLPLISRLHREHNAVTSVYGRPVSYTHLTLPTKA